MKILEFMCDVCNKAINRREYHFIVKKETPFIFIPAENDENCPEKKALKKKNPKEKKKIKDNRLKGQVVNSYHFCSLEHLTEWTNQNLK